MTATNHKITRTHLSRDAIAYIRQSGAHQVRNNHESRRRQYALVERAKSLGWPARSIKTVDDDQGRTATCAEHRHGLVLLRELTWQWCLGQLPMSQRERYERWQFR